MKDNLVSSEIAEPYAQALMGTAQSADLVDKMGEDVAFLRSILKDSDELQAVLASPVVKPETKKGILRQIAGETVHSYTLNFLQILVDRGRIVFLDSICSQFQTLLRELRQTALAEVVSAVELSDEQKESVRQKVIQISGARQVELQTSVDPDLIGGVIIKVGSQVIDASLRGQLRRISLRLTSAS